MNEARSTIITVWSVDGRRKDYDFLDSCQCSEIDCPPWSPMVIVGA